MHWIKGSPDDNDTQGEYRELTFWEQIDDGKQQFFEDLRRYSNIRLGRPWTTTKKLMMIVPTALFSIASIVTDYAVVDLAINMPIWIVLILGKLPEFHRVRIFGINSTVGIDDSVKVD